MSLRASSNRLADRCLEVLIPRNESYLAGVCNNGSWLVLSLDGVASYGAPAGQLATPCECNTVFYNIIEACSACQGGSINQWQYWIQNCPQSYIGTAFPYPIPAGTQVPTWADIDPTTVGFWSPTIASAYAGKIPFQTILT